jgi:hypothetical protein
VRIWLLLVGLVLASAARADDGEPVVVLVTRSDGAFVRRVRAELESMGFSVVTRGHVGDLPEATVAVGRLSEGPPARLAIEPVGAGEPQSVVFDDDVTTEIGSVRVAERLRAAFQPLAPRPPAAPRSDASESPEAAPATSETAAAHDDAFVVNQPPERPAPESSPPEPRAGAGVRLAAPAARWPMGVAVGPALLVEAGGVGFGITASYYLSPVPGLRLAALLSAPIVPTSRSGAEGSADLYPALLGLVAEAVVVDHERFELVLGGGAAGVWLRAVGQPESGYIGRTEDAVTAAWLVDAALRIHIHDGFSLAPRAYLGIALPVVDVEFAGRRAGVWGLPLAITALTGELDFDGR